MIVASLLLILVAVVLLVVGLTGGSSLLLAASIAASLLAAVALVVGARQAAATRAAAGRSDPDAHRARRRPAGDDPEAGEPTPAGPDIPVQHVPTTSGADDTGWRQSPGSSAVGEDPHVPPADGQPYPAEGPHDLSFDGQPYADQDDPYAGPADPDQVAVPPDEPPALRVSPPDAALVARLDAEVQVVDGRPRYHLADCPHLFGRDAEPLPVAEAVRLGFTPCARCAPDTFLLADARPL
ncbi:hypothetical protein C5N14_15730 [Micromonospora sp. MW-13]|uniref:hypothetical protein n=1 Tax=unclassified Micromonospora TaxID=2617518 RepID=UPI000E4535BD|nr:MULTISPECIES: hypothetical protein [unclassified Micromonospora]MCX4471018.1 hypothetical protein [Micromonospora sp. NBC_01655]RGC67933.1 hypothetical protein C5N14_15730 [Micromonospora sp. MW-13]